MISKKLQDSALKVMEDIDDALAGETNDYSQLRIEEAHAISMLMWALAEEDHQMIWGIWANLDPHLTEFIPSNISKFLTLTVERVIQEHNERIQCNHIKSNDIGQNPTN